MKITFTPKRFSASSLSVIDEANNIIAEYQRDGLILTLRQLYYQFVSRDLISNTQKEYLRLGNIVNDARLAGLIDWDVIEDRGRNLQSLSTWSSPKEIIRACASQYKTDLWKNQDCRVEVWIEKQALEGVIESICQSLRVAYFSCKGYVSQSEMFNAGYNRFRKYIQNGQLPVILHFGDHDPSGIDMTRDISERLKMFSSSNIEVRRLALNWDQIEVYDPPPNPAKVSDTRFETYMKSFGSESWELDALDPHVLVNLISSEVDQLKDRNKWEKSVSEEAEHKKVLLQIEKQLK